jgi:hypothetical protein
MDAQSITAERVSRRNTKPRKIRTAIEGHRKTYQVRYHGKAAFQPMLKPFRNFVCAEL